MFPGFQHDVPSFLCRESELYPGGFRDPRSFVFAWEGRNGGRVLFGTVFIASFGFDVCWVSGWGYSVMVDGWVSGWGGQLRCVRSLSRARTHPAHESICLVVGFPCIDFPFHGGSNLFCSCGRKF